MRNRNSCPLCRDVKDEKIAVLWNPSVGKPIGIPIYNSLVLPNGLTFIGFGVCPNTSDPKLVRINTIGYPTVLNWEVEVYTLSTRVWKSISNIPPAFRTCQLTFGYVFVDGFIYWRAYANINLADGIKSHFIISFNSKSDEFGKVCLPAGRLVRTNKFTISKVYESLGLFEYYKEGEKRFCDVWIMKEGATKSFTKMLSIEAPDRWMSYRVLELRKNGEAIIENIDDTITNYSSVLEVYDPSSGRRISGLGINGYPYSLSMKFVTWKPDCYLISPKFYHKMRSWQVNGWLKTQNRMSKWISIADFECVFCKLEKHSLKKSVECVTGLLIGALVYDLWQERNSRFRPLGLNLMASKQVKEAFEIWGFHLFETDTSAQN
ncbi:RNA polymerase II largest subunit [Tanacetum coccineum]